MLQNLRTPMDASNNSISQDLDIANETIVFSINRETSASASIPKSHANPKSTDSTRENSPSFQPQQPLQQLKCVITAQTDMHASRKLCIVSTCSGNSVLKTAEKTFSEYQVCHHLFTHGGVSQLLQGIERKLLYYTMDDLCIILLGHRDFRNTNNYVEIINLIREKINCIKNTNIVICTPTYLLKDNSRLINKRIETFNNILCKDILQHKHAFLLDSNNNLQYTYRMFWRRSGLINNVGLLRIFNDLKLCLPSINRSHSGPCGLVLGSIENSNCYVTPQDTVRNTNLIFLGLSQGQDLRPFPLECQGEI
jgi:hypothetical protein